MLNYIFSREIEDSVVIGIQARISSQRLPRKALMPIKDTTILGATISRCLASGLKTYVLTSNQVEDDLIENESKKYKVSGVLRGSLVNVLSRYQNLEKETQAKYIIRVTADNPFTDTLGIINLANQTLKNNYLYLRNLEEDLPIGYHSELFNSKELYKPYNNNDLAKEHVTYSIKKNVKISYAESLNYGFNEINLKKLECSIDTKIDYIKAINLIKNINSKQCFESLNLTKKLILNIDK